MAFSRASRSFERRQPHRAGADFAESGFTCRHCTNYVTCAPEIAGVQNRNHCPYCLWSRHLDGAAAGDRRSACRATMRPVGLTTKRSRNKYARERDGELMIIHQCTVCAKLVLNRIAADDSDSALIDIFEASFAPSPSVAAKLAAAGVVPLAPGERDLVRRRLFGAAPPLSSNN
jgi:hypothetical protein